MTAKQDALNTIAALAAQHDITLDEIGARLTQGYVRDKGGKWLVRVLGYLGSTLIFGGLALFIGMKWNDLNSPARVIITYGPGLVAFILGIITMKDERFKNAATPLFLKSAILQPFGMFVFLHEYGSGDDAQLAALVVFGIVALQFLGAFLMFQRTTLLFFGYLFWNAATGILLDRAHVPGDQLGIGLGLSIMMVAWGIDRTEHRGIAPFWYFLGSVGLLWSLFDVVDRTPFDTAYLAIAAFMMFLSVRMHSRTLLLVSTFALLGFLGYYTNQYFKDMVGWPIALMVMGFLLVGISYYAVKLGQKIGRA